MKIFLFYFRIISTINLIALYQTNLKVEKYLKQKDFDYQLIYLEHESLK